MRIADARHLFGVLNSASTLTFKLLRGPFSQAELSDTLHVRETNIREWESGRAKPTPAHLRDLLMHFRDWTRELGWPGLDILIAANTRKRKETPCRKHASTNSPRATLTGSAKPSPASSAIIGG